MKIKYLYAQWHKLEVVPPPSFLEDGFVTAGDESEPDENGEIQSPWELLEEELLQPYIANGDDSSDVRRRLEFALDIATLHKIGKTHKGLSFVPQFEVYPGASLLKQLSV
ncbi:MAG: hypothetical protein PHN84_02235 [Desulfuromonadaceae bacterium]|nr:hypothetical protein [Desulfuromonadaceae bacterium]MDD2856571.1 hypothetical protein [Desulfuromonadaceae bacterium]